MAFNKEYYQFKKQKLNQGFINKMDSTLATLSNIVSDYQESKRNFEESVREITEIERGNAKEAEARKVSVPESEKDAPIEGEFKKEEIKK